MAVLLGRQTAGTSGDFNVLSAAWKFTAVASGTLATIKAQSKVANPESTSLQLAIYADDAGGTRPGTRLATASTSVGNTGTGVISVDVSASAVSIVSGTAYWLAWFGSSHWDFQGDSGGSYVEASGGSPLPATWGSSNGSGSVNAILWGESAAGGTDGGVTAPAGVLTLSGVAPAITASGSVTAPAGALTLAGPTATITSGTVVVSPSGLLTLSASAPSVTASGSVTAPSGVVTLSATAPTVSSGRAVSAPSGVVTLAASAPTLSSGNTVSAPAGVIFLESLSASIDNGEAIAIIWIVPDLIPGLILALDWTTRPNRNQ